MKQLARIISFVSNPLLITLPIPFVVIYIVTQNLTYAVKWQMFTSLFLIITAVFIVYGIRKGFFSNFDVSIRKQRKVLFFFTALITILYLLSIIILKGPPILILIVLSMIVAVFLFSSVNIYLKASLHVATTSALVVSLILIYGGIFYSGIILIPAVAWSRVVTKRHTFYEVIVGGIIGSVLSIMTYIIGRFLFS